MTDEQLKAIRDTAKKATPGSWWAGECKPADGHALAWLGNWFVDCEGGQRNYVDPSLDAAYIAAAQPATVIALLDEIESLRKDADRYRWLRDTYAEDKDIGIKVYHDALDEWIPYADFESMEEELDAAMDGLK